MLDIGFGSALANCLNGTPSTIVFGNGISTTLDEAQFSLDNVLKPAILQSLDATVDPSCLSFALAYDSTFVDSNNTVVSTGNEIAQIVVAAQQLNIDFEANFWAYWDSELQAPAWFEDIQRAFITSATLPFQPDLLTHEAFYTSQLALGQRIVVVAHSQGSLYANQAYDVVTAQGGSDLFHIVAVATPAHSIAGFGPYFTLAGDVITLVPGSLPENIANDPPSPCLDGHAVACHLFDSSYMDIQNGDKTRPAIINAVLAALPVANQPLVVTEFSAGISANAQLGFITAGPDGNIWFTETEFDCCGTPTVGRIGRITPAGVITEFSAGITFGAWPMGITAGPDGNLWFTEYHGNRIGRITPAGAVTEFSAGLHANAVPEQIATGPDGNLWFTERGVNTYIGRITPSGVITEFGSGTADGITAGPDGNLWFAEWFAIGRITPAGVVTEFGISSDAYAGGITAGSDGNLWFTECIGNRIGRITPAGAVTEFSEGISSNACPYGITAGSDGNLWFTECISGSGSRIGRITPTGAVTEFSQGIAANACGITAGPDGNLWFTEVGPKGIIGRITIAK